MEAKVSFLQEKNKKTNEELKEEKEVHRKAVDKLNLSLAFNQKLEAYVGNTGTLINKAQLFNANLAQHLVTAKKGDSDVGGLCGQDGGAPRQDESPLRWALARKCLP